MSAADIGGWVGTALVLAAFAWVTFRKTPDVWFQMANGFGAVLLGLDGLSHHAAPVVGLNLAWCLISIAGLWNLWRHALTREERARIAGWPDEAARWGEWGGLDVVVDPHCPPDKVFLLDKRMIATGPEAAEFMGEMLGVSVDPAPWREAWSQDVDDMIERRRAEARARLRGKDSHPVYGTDHPPSSWGEG